VGSSGSTPGVKGGGKENRRRERANCRNERFLSTGENRKEKGGVLPPKRAQGPERCFAGKRRAKKAKVAVGETGQGRGGVPKKKFHVWIF